MALQALSLYLGTHRAQAPIPQYVDQHSDECRRHTLSSHLSSASPDVLRLVIGGKCQGHVSTIPAVRLRESTWFRNSVLQVDVPREASISRVRVGMTTMAGRAYITLQTVFDFPIHRQVSPHHIHHYLIRPSFSLYYLDLIFSSTSIHRQAVTPH